MPNDLSKEQCEAFLADNHYAHLGCIDGDEPYVVPITYLYKDGFFYGYTQEGKKLELMRKHPRVCVQVERVDADGKWDSVISHCIFEEITGAENIQAIKLMLAEEHGKILKEKGEHAYSPLINQLHQLKTGDVEHGRAYRIQPYKITGRSDGN